MNKSCQFVLALALVFGLVTPGLCQDAKAKRLKPNAARKDRSSVHLPKDITLTDEQKKKVEEIEKEYAPKMKDLHEKLKKVLTEEQKKARHNVTKDAKTGGKRGKEVQQAVKEAMKLTEEQQKEHKAIESKIRELRQEILEKVKPTLTDDQKAKLPHRKVAGRKPKDKQAA